MPARVETSALTCLQCAGPIPRRQNEAPCHYVKRRFCGVPCLKANQQAANAFDTERKQAAMQERHADMIEDVAFLLSVGEHPTRILQRTGASRSVTSLVRRMDRFGRHDLARELERRMGA